MGQKQDGLLKHKQLSISRLILISYVKINESGNEFPLHFGLYKVEI